MTKTNLCDCGSNLEYSVCCGPLISGKKTAATADELLRARYTAFARHEIDFVLNSHHSKTRHDVKREEIEDWSKNSQWHGLQIAQIEGGKATDDKATIVFCARYTAEGKEQEHWEQSFFEKEDGQWRFFDAKGVHVGTYRRAEPKVGRNDACPCGSGKKFKKCCSTAA
jgi:SEC-C motif-containing protein